jgi:hypothetical protein
MQIERIDWQAEKDAMRAEAYFRRLALTTDYLTLRGMTVAERVSYLLASRERMARILSQPASRSGNHLVAY